MSNSKPQIAFLLSCIGARNLQLASSLWRLDCIFPATLWRHLLATTSNSFCSHWRCGLRWRAQNLPRRPRGCWKRWLAWKRVRFSCGWCEAVPVSFVWPAACNLSGVQQPGLATCDKRCGIFLVSWPVRTWQRQSGKNWAPSRPLLLTILLHCEFLCWK